MSSEDVEALFRKYMESHGGAGHIINVLVSLVLTPLTVPPLSHLHLVPLVGAMFMGFVILLIPSVIYSTIYNFFTIYGFFYDCRKIRADFIQKDALLEDLGWQHRYFITTLLFIARFFATSLYPSLFFVSIISYLINLVVCFVYYLVRALFFVWIPDRLNFEVVKWLFRSNIRSDPTMQAPKEPPQ